jgi:hypothetical protein
MDSSHIAQREYLSQYPQISLLVFHVLEVAQAGGMTEKKAESLYKQILDCLSELKGDAFWLFRDELIRILVTPDSQFADDGKSAGWQTPGRN